MDRMSNPFRAPLRLPVRASRIYLGTVIAFHIGLVWPTLLSTGPAWYRLTLLVAISLSLAVNIGEVYAAVRLLRSVMIGANNEWSAATREGEIHRAELLASSVVTTHFIVLCLALDNGTRVRLFMESRTHPQDQLRRLRVRLRPIA